MHTHTGPTRLTGQLKRTVSPHRENTADVLRDLGDRGLRPGEAWALGSAEASSEFCPCA